MITHATFEALSVFDDGYTHWFAEDISGTSALVRKTYIVGANETGWRLTLAGEAALTEYRAKHGLIPAPNYHRATS